MYQNLMDALNELIQQQAQDVALSKATDMERMRDFQPKGNEIFIAFGLPPLAITRTEEGSLYIGNGDYGIEIDQQGCFCIVGG